MVVHRKCAGAEARLGSPRARKGTPHLLAPRAPATAVRLGWEGAVPGRTERSHADVLAAATLLKAM